MKFDGSMIGPHYCVFIIAAKDGERATESSNLYDNIKVSSFGAHGNFKAYFSSECLASINTHPEKFYKNSKQALSL
jgi:hypothetical protein